MVLVVGSPREGTTVLEVLLPSWEGKFMGMRAIVHLWLLKCSAGHMVFAVNCKLLRTEFLSFVFFFFLLFCKVTCQSRKLYP